MSGRRRLEIIVGKWKTIFLLHLLKNGTLRFSDLKRSIPNIPPKMLTKKELANEDIIE